MAGVNLDHEFLDKVDATSWKNKSAVISLSFVLTGAVYSVVYLISHALWETFRSQLSSKDKLNWCRASTVCVFAAVSSGISIWCAAVDDTLTNNVVNGTSTLSFVVICISVGYHIFDTGVLVVAKLLFTDYSRSTVLVHHIFTILAHGIMSHCGKAHFFGVQGLFFEVAALFKYFGWMLTKTKTDNHSIWKTNQLLVIHLLHCRSVLELYWVYIIFQNWDYIVAEMPFYTAVLPLCTWLAGSILWFTPQCIYKETKLLFKFKAGNEVKQQCNGFSHSHHFKPELQHGKQG